MSFTPQPPDKIKFRLGTNWQVEGNTGNAEYFQANMKENLPLSGLMDQI